MLKFFGTDGIRGTANRAPVRPEDMLRLGMAVGHLARKGARRPRVVIGKDTRLSGYMIEAALMSGLTASGAAPVLVGPMPTPAVAMLTRSLRADLGVMITASHNPYQDNGVKLFDAEGYKFPDAQCAIVEKLMQSDSDALLAKPEELGHAQRLNDAPGRYIEFVKQTFPAGMRLDGMKIVLDCANGAAYQVAPQIFRELGAKIITIGTTPNGTNINKDCGATCVKTMRAKVVASEADIGIAFDGDADRVLVADETGTLIDGDQIIALIARAWARQGRLAESGVVGTIMSNLGLETYFRSLDVPFQRTPVGDHHVMEHMRAHGQNLGGEACGHIIIGDCATTGDGLVAALQVLAAIVGAGLPASQVCRVFEPTPQYTRNVPLQDPEALAQDAVVRKIAEAEERLGSEGRLIVRKSGTEPLIRVTTEGYDRRVIGAVLEDVVETIRMAA